MSSINVYRNFSEIPRDPETVLTVGTFDGIHRGHRLIIDRLLEISRKCSLRAVLVSFHPHPQIVLRKKGMQPVCLLTSIEERIALLERFGVENVLVIPFDYEFSLVPGNGVYLIRGLVDGQRRYGMANIGTRPTFKNSDERTIEAHFFGLEQELYGEWITLEFLNYLRPERKFDSVDDLIGQLDSDREKSLELIEKFYN
ncbi:MAG: riboflavin kinase [Bacteroidota bacterium]